MKSTISIANAITVVVTNGCDPLTGICPSGSKVMPLRYKLGTVVPSSSISGITTVFWYSPYGNVANLLGTSDGTNLIQRPALYYLEIFQTD